MRHLRISVSLGAATEAISELGVELPQFSDWLKTASELDADTACQFVADSVTFPKGGAA